MPGVFAGRARQTDDVDGRRDRHHGLRRQVLIRSSSVARSRWVRRRSLETRGSVFGRGSGRAWMDRVDIDLTGSVAFEARGDDALPVGTTAPSVRATGTTPQGGSAGTEKPFARTGDSVFGPGQLRADSSAALVAAALPASEISLWPAWRPGLGRVEEVEVVEVGPGLDGTPGEDRGRARRPDDATGRRAFDVRGDAASSGEATTPSVPSHRNESSEMNGSGWTGRSLVRRGTVFGPAHTNTAGRHQTRARSHSCVSHHSPAPNLLGLPRVTSKPQVGWRGCACVLNPTVDLRLPPCEANADVQCARVDEVD